MQKQKGDLNSEPTVISVSREKVFPVYRQGPHIHYQSGLRFISHPWPVTLSEFRFVFYRLLNDTQRSNLDKKTWYSWTKALALKEGIHSGRRKRSLKKVGKTVERLVKVWKRNESEKILKISSQERNDEFPGNIAPFRATVSLYLTCFCQLSASFSGQFDKKFSRKAKIRPHNNLNFLGHLTKLLVKKKNQRQPVL